MLKWATKQILLYKQEIASSRFETRGSCYHCWSFERCESDVNFFQFPLTSCLWFCFESICNCVIEKHRQCKLNDSNWIYIECVWVCVCAPVFGAVVISPQTFAGGQGPGNGKGCWRRVTSWAVASPMNHWAAGAVAGSPLSVQPLLPAARKTHSAEG